MSPRVADINQKFSQELFPRASRYVESGWFQSTIFLIEKFVEPGLTVCLLLRKKFIEEFTLKKLSEGYGQLIILGSGFDTLGFRIAQEFPQISVIEMDRKQVLFCKREMLNKHYGLPQNINFCPADFIHDDWKTLLLKATEKKKESKTLVIAEGLLMYLPPTTVRDIFDSLLTTLSQPQFLFSFINSEYEVQQRISRFFLKSKNEAYQWLTPKSNIATYLDGVGWSLKEVFGISNLAEKFLVDKSLSLSEDEEYCIAILKTQSLRVIRKIPIERLS